MNNTLWIQFKDYAHASHFSFFFNSTFFDISNQIHKRKLLEMYVNNVAV